MKLVDRERALGSDFPSLVYVLDATDTEAEADAEVEADCFDPKRETDSYTDKRKERDLTKEVEKINVPCSNSLSN